MGGLRSACCAQSAAFGKLRTKPVGYHGREYAKFEEGEDGVGDRDVVLPAGEYAGDAHLYGGSRRREKGEEVGRK